MEDKFNIFNFLGLENKETIHSKFIASLLKEDEKIYNKFMEIIFEGGNGVKNEHYIDFNNAVIETEKVLYERDNKNNSFGRADIWIGHKHGTGNRRIIIENKIYAGDQWQQLNRYDTYLKQHPREGVLFYLTLQGKPASSHSTENNKGNEKYTIISYKKHIKSWLDLVVKSDEAGRLKDATCQYMDCIQELTKVYSKIDEYFENDYNVNLVNKYKSEYKATLELYFWDNLCNELNKLGNISNQRLYSYDKIYRYHTKGKIDRAYGIILNDQIRIQVGDKTNNKRFVVIGNGNLDKTENNWTWKSKQVTSFDLNEINCKRDAENMAKQIYETDMFF